MREPTLIRILTGVIFTGYEIASDEAILCPTGSAIQKLGKMDSDRIDHSDFLTDEQVARTMERQIIAAVSQLEPTAALKLYKFSASQGSTIEIFRSEKCRTFRVASVARRASAIPAICVSRMSTGRPSFRRAAANAAASVAAEISKSNTRFSRSSFSSRPNAASSAFRRRPDGNSAKPNSASNKVMLVIQTDLAGW